MAQQIVSKENDKRVNIVFEEEENDEFWSVLGGKESYSNDKRLRTESDCQLPRLFQLTNSKGRFSIEEIFNFDRTDLIQEDIMILDVWDAIFVWIGQLSNRDERGYADEAVLDYLRTDPRERDTNIPIIKIKQGHEPPIFTGFFGAWNTDNNEIDDNSCQV